MPHPSLFNSLREAQARSAREQRLLSGRVWLLAAAIAQFLTALHPANRYALALTVRDTSPDVARLPWVLGAQLLLSLVLLALWGWARHAPYRAAATALGIFVALHAASALIHPASMLDHIASNLLVLLGLVLAVHTGHLRRQPH